MSCPGVHCACCAGGISLPIVPLAWFFGAVWIAEHIVEVAIVCGVSGTLAVAAVVALMRWADRRETTHAAARSIWTTRADALPPRETRTIRSDSAPAALGFRDLHIHLDGQPTAEQAAVIRQALGRS